MSDTLNKVVSALKESADTGPDGASQLDWDPRIAVLKPDGSVKLLVINTSWLEPQNKAAMYEALEGFIKQQGGVAAGTLNSTWVVGTHSKEEAEKALRLMKAGRSLENVPGRKEQLIIVALEAGGDEVWHSQITRDSKGVPSKGEWKEMGTAGSVTMGGAVTAALQTGLGLPVTKSDTDFMISGSGRPPSGLSEILSGDNGDSRPDEPVQEGDLAWLDTEDLMEDEYNALRTRLEGDQAAVDLKSKQLGKRVQQLFKFLHNRYGLRAAPADPLRRSRRILSVTSFAFWAWSLVEQLNSLTEAQLEEKGIGDKHMVLIELLYMLYRFGWYDREREYQAQVPAVFAELELNTDPDKPSEEK